jgi:RND family efflux transporter MFP subunit
VISKPAFTDGRGRTPPGGWLAWLVLACVLASSCRGGPGTGGGPPAMPVEVVTLRERPVEQATEFVGTVKSLRFTTVRPQVEGFVTRILARSGDHVEPGRPLMQVDPRMQQAAVANLESQRAARAADLSYAQQDAARTKTLYEAGAASQSELEHAQTTLQAAEAQLKAVEAQIKEQQVALGYYMVTAQTQGVVGDIPVRLGDRVTRDTTLTTIDQNAGLELYIDVPVQEAEHLKLGLPVHLVDDAGRRLLTTQLSFVAPSVDADTQSVLVKAELDPSSGLRTGQFVRARVVWTETPSLTIPFVAVSRINGQYFGFVAATAEGGQLVARQRQLDLGAVVGNDYIVRSGLKPGEQLIVSGIQNIADGAPVRIVAPAADPSQAAAAAEKGR